MWILMLEAIVALFLLVFIVWWTMFSGRDDAAVRKQARPPARKENDTPET
jgi:nitrogen fixation-related uncharacterized protein